MVVTHLERELKFEVSDGFAPADWSRLPGVVQVSPVRVDHLKATYFDTRGLDLLQAGATLRRRTGGTDPGWHAELRSAGGARLEAHRPPGRATRTAPKELTRLLTAILRGRTPRPVATISIDRTVVVLHGRDGRLLAEIAQDDVTAQVPPAQPTGPKHAGAGVDPQTISWAEIEVELVDGDPSLLQAVATALQANGAHPARASSKIARVLGELQAHTSPVNGSTGLVPWRAPSGASQRSGHPVAGQAALAYLRGQVAELQARDPEVRLDLPDAVHKMRVATRRLRSALATFRPLFDRRATEPLRAELQWLGGVLGAARDAEVLRQRLLAALDTLPDDLMLGPVRQRIDADLSARYRAAHRDVITALDGDRYLGLLEALDAFLDDPPATDTFHAKTTRELARLTHRAARRVERAIDAIPTRSADLPGQAPHHDSDRALAQAREHQLHEVRKTAKRARYAAESVRPELGKRARDLAKAMKALTEHLGNHQDSVIAKTELVALADSAHQAGEHTFTYGVLHALQTHAAHGEEKAFRTAQARAHKATQRIA